MIQFSWAELEFTAGKTLILWCDKHAYDNATLYQAIYNAHTDKITFHYELNGAWFTDVMPMFN